MKIPVLLIELLIAKRNYARIPYYKLDSGTLTKHQAKLDYS